MYNITAMKNRPLKFGLGVWGVVAAGAGITWVAVEVRSRCLGEGRRGCRGTHMYWGRQLLCAPIYTRWCS